MPETQNDSNISILKNFILPKFHYEIERVGGNNGYIILTEENLTQVRINQVPNDLFAIKLDKQNTFSGKIFSGTKGETCCCDFILFCETYKVIIFIEIKTTKDDSSHVKKQLKSTDCVFDYIQTVGKKFFEKDDFFDGYKRKYIVFDRLFKRNTTKEHLKSYNDPSTYDKPLFLSGNNVIYFKRLIMETCDRE